MINTWTDPWIPDHPPRLPRALGNVDDTSQVSQLVLQEWSNCDVKNKRSDH